MNSLKQRFKGRSRGRSLLTVFLAFAGLLTVLVVFGSWHWTLELFTHYRPHIALLCVLLTLGCVVRERYVMALVMLAATAFHALVLAVHWLPTQRPQPTAGESTRVVALNLSASNRRIDLVASLIKRESPALLALTEVSARELIDLAPALAGYHQAVNTDVEGFGVALLSRSPIDAARSVMLGDRPYPAMVVDLEIGGEPARVVVAHPPPPISSTWASAHADQLGSLRTLVGQDPQRHVMVLGDLNATRWSPGFRQLVDGSGLRSASLGFPYRPTWPAGLGPLGIPIDHALVSRAVVVTQYRVGPRVGSDHLPIIVDLSLNPR